MAITNPDFDLSSSSSPVSKTDFDPPTTTAVNDSDVVFTDITTGNASTTKHGFLKKLSNVATEFLNGAGNFVTLAQSSITDLVTDLAAKIAGSTGSTDNRLLRSDGTGGKTVQATNIDVTDADAVTITSTGSNPQLLLTRNYNGYTGFRVSNTTSGTNAVSTFAVVAGTTSFAFSCLSEGFTSSGRYTAATTIVDHNIGTGGLSFSAGGGSNLMRWWLGTTEVMRLNAAGLGIGLTPTAVLHLKAGQRRHQQPH